MRCCVDIVKFILFFVNLIAFLIFLGLDIGSVFVLLKAEDTFVGQPIEYSLSESNDTAIYFALVVIALVVFTFFLLFTCLGCCGTAFKSNCMLGSFIVIEFAMFGSSVGAILFLHYCYSQPVPEILEEEMSKSIVAYHDHSTFVEYFWDWLTKTAMCCGVGKEGINIWSSATLKDGYKVPRGCCMENHECMYEPNRDNTYMRDCVPIAIPYVQAVLYGVPSIMFLSLVFAFIVVNSFKRIFPDRRKETRPYHTHSQYSIGAEDEFQHTHGEPAHQPTAPYENAPYNPSFNPEIRSISDYPTGNIPPPQADYTSPLLHQPPPSYHEAIHYAGKPMMSYNNR